MRIVTDIPRALQSLFGSIADEVAKDHAVVLRRRKFSTTTLAQTFVLGYLAKPRASDEDLARTAALCGVDVSPQAIEQRFTDRLTQFLEALFRRATQHVVATQGRLAPVVERFPAVVILDSSTISLPDSVGDRFPGCGGGRGGGVAAMKLQVQWDLRSGAINAVAIEPGRDCDYKSSLQSAALTPGTLRIADLGYFDTKVFQDLSNQGVFWLSRLQFNTSVFSRDNELLPLLEWLAEQPGPFVDTPILLGTERKVACRMIAWRVPPEVASRRRQKLIRYLRAKDGRTPSRERLAWCDWTILVTNTSVELLAPLEAIALYCARWQIELLFKRWKSQGLIAELNGSTTARQLVRLWSRLLAALVEHWLILGSAWTDARCSLMKASKAIREHAVLVIATLGDRSQLGRMLDRLANLLRQTTRMNKKAKPSTWEILQDPSRLGYTLT